MLPLKEIVLLGVGHTHAHVLRMWKMQPLPDVRLTCLTDYPVATYSGMLPGVLAGQYPKQRMEIDLVRFSAAAGVRLLYDRVTGLDRDGSQLLFERRPPLPFDLLSIGIGSQPSLDGIGGDLSHLLPIKPMQTFLERFQQRCTARGKQETRVVVVGGGAGGIEIALCLPAALRAHCGERAYSITVVHTGPAILEEMSRGTQRRVTKELERRGVRLEMQRRVASVERDAVVLDDGRRIASDITIWATSARGPDLLPKLGLPLDERGFLRTKTTLQSIADPRIFAVGDSGSMEAEPLPKAGVYAVREGPILWTNFHRALNNQPLQEYRPQKRFLKLLNLGDGRAVADYRGWSAAGRWCWRWKDRIDGEFMDRYQDYRPTDMGMPLDAMSPAMRCLGCGGKLGAAPLHRVLRQLALEPSPNVEIGLDKPDDAALIRTTGERLAVTVDHFISPFEDAYLAGRVAALNAASDLYAFGSEPNVALASITIPYGPIARQEQLLLEVLSGALHEFRAMQIALAGGHTLEGAQLSIGFTLLGPADATIWTKGGLRVGDHVGVTKALGTGVLLAGHMHAELSAANWRPLVDSLLTSNRAAAALLREVGVSAVTDVTGFGLAGHLAEMLDASGHAAELQLGAIPLLPGAAELLAEGWESTLAPENRHIEQRIEAPPALRPVPAFRALFDPQTSGGLLFGASDQQRAAVEESLASSGVGSVHWIGRVVARTTDETIMRIVE